MTLKELATAILALPADKQENGAAVFPPDGCPAREMVDVVGLLTDRTGNVYLSTGKTA